MISKKWIIILFTPLFSLSQSDTLVLEQRIDSLMELDFVKYSNEVHQGLHQTIEESRRLKYHKGLMHSSLGLVCYYFKHHNIDSIFYQVDYLEKHFSRYPNNKLESKFYAVITRQFLSKGNFPNKALEYNLKVIEKYNDPKVKILAQSIFLECYNIKGKYEKTIKEYNKILVKYPNVFGDQTSVNFSNLSISAIIAYQKMGDIKKSEYLLDIVEKYTELDHKVLIAEIRLYRAYNNYLKGEYQKSIDSLSSNYHFFSKHISHLLPKYYEYLALSYSKINHINLAITATKKSISLNINSFGVPELYKDLSDFYKSLGKTDSTIYYLELRDQLVDSIRQIEERIYEDYYNIKKENIDIALTNDVICKEKEVLIQSNINKKWYLVVLGIFLAIVVFLYKWLIRKYKLIKRKVIDVNKQKDNLQTKIAIKDRKITATLISQEQRLDRLKHIKQEIGEHLHSNKSELIKKNLNMLDKVITRGIGKDDVIGELIYQNEELVTVLKQRCFKLSKTDLVHCILVHREINIKDSADLLCVNTNTVRTARYCAKSKLELHKEDSMSKFLDQLIKGDLKIA